MTWYRDLDPCPYFGPQYVHSLRAVGWLGAGKDFPTGRTPDGLVEKLRLLNETQWDLWYPKFLGFHTCELCDDRSVHSWKNLYIPGDGVVYVAPEGIIHYIEAHDYLPPLEFRTAVERCPPGDSADYYEVLARTAPYLGTGQDLLDELRRQLQTFRERQARWHGREVPRQWFEGPDEEIYFAYSATLRIFGNIPDVHEIMKRLGVSANVRSSRGAPRRQGAPPEASWAFSPKVPEERPMEEHINALWSVLKPHRDYLLDLKRTLDVDVLLGYRSNCDFAVIEVPHTCLEMFIELEIPFGVSITNGPANRPGMDSTWRGTAP